MKSSCQNEQLDNKRKYVFFSDPDVIAKRAESSAIAAQIKQDLEVQQQNSKKQSVEVSVPTLGIKGLENLLSYHPVQPYPFTFISAVKQKLALASHPNITKTHNPNFQAKHKFTSSVLKTNCKQNPYQVVQKMDFIRPLKVPDLKISPKTLDFSSRENTVSKELSSTKCEIVSKDFVHDRSEKTIKTGERVSRKLDFSLTEGPSIMSCEDIEPLKAPNVSIASNLSKKKEHIRDNSKEKENRSKRIKKDDSFCTKRNEFPQDQVKRSKSPKHSSRRDVVDNMSDSMVSKLKNERLPFHTKTNDFLSPKSKGKNFMMASSKKDNDKKHRSFNARSTGLTKNHSLESKGRVCKNESFGFRSWKLPDTVTRENITMAILTNNFDNKSKDSCHLKQVEELKYKCDTENRPLKQDKTNTIHKEQTKRISDKNKSSNNKIEGKVHNMDSEPSEDIECTSETNSSETHMNVYPINLVQQSKGKDLETTMKNKQSINSVRSGKMPENLKYQENSLTQFISTNNKKDEESYSQSTGTKQTSTNDDSNNVEISTLPKALFDARRISFRNDDYSQQEEFHNLTTPDKTNFTLKSKRRKCSVQSSDSEVDTRYPKHKTTVKSEKEQEKTQFMHPSALHMQFQAELHLLDSFNESLRQVMDVEKCLYNTKHEQEQKNLRKETEKGEEIRTEENLATTAIDNDIVEKAAWKNVTESRKSNTSDEGQFTREHHILNQANIDELSNNFGKFNKAIVKVAEVQTQTVNDIATQTELYADKRNTQNRLSEMHGDTYEQTFLEESEVPQLSLSSAEQFEDLDQIEEISLPSRIRTMSEISLHETTSSIKTETGTEISISTRDVTCSFNKYLDLEIAQLIKDEKQRYDKIEMLFKSREKTLNDRTKKLVKLEEQKRALRDTGQDSRISSVKKKQRALLLKLQQEKDEMNRLKELHEIASQERKLMLQKQRNMFNPQMSTKNILTKLKRSADSQSPRRLSGPMKGYDIRSNSSMSSLVDSDKSQHDRSHIDTRLHASENDIRYSKPEFVKSDKSLNLVEESITSETRFYDIAENCELQENNSPKSQKKDSISKYELKSRKYEEKMPRTDILRLKSHQFDIQSKLIQTHPINIKRLMENQKSIEISQVKPALEPSIISDCVKSESDTLVEELSKRSKMSQIVDASLSSAAISKEKSQLSSNIITANSESIEEEIHSKVQDTVSKSKSSQISENVIQANTIKNFKKNDKLVVIDKDTIKKQQHAHINTELKLNSKRKNSKHQKTKTSSILTENMPWSKQTRIEHDLPQLSNNENLILDKANLDESQNSFQALVMHSETIRDNNPELLSELINDHVTEENISNQISNRKPESDKNLSKNEYSTENVSTSQISTFAISHHSFGEKEKDYLKSVVVRSQERDFKSSKKLEQILTARETALASRKNCVEEWMARYARLRTEEERVIRMEQAAFKLVAASNVLSQQDTTVSSDTSDVEGRIELLTEKLAERRVEMSRLKKEARKQAKQELRTLEANLLNQIKSYDTTIHEMRKKLESKRVAKSNDKLAIEPKSLADFKVPEIPLKKLKDIYKSSDLFRSRSESDLLTKNQQKDTSKITNPIIHNEEHEKCISQDFKNSANAKNINVSKLKSTIITPTDHSIHSIFDECISIETCDNYEKDTSISSTSNNAHTENVHLISDKNHFEESTEAEMKQDNVSYEEEIQTNISTVNSELDIQTISDAKFSEDHSIINTVSTNNKLNTDTNTGQSPAKTSVTESDILEVGGNIEYSKSIPSKSDFIENSEATDVDSNYEILTFSKKLDFLQSNNKNLNNDISCLENELKALSEIMSCFSNNSKEKIITTIDNDEKNTSQHISEIISKSIFSDKVVDTESEDQQTSHKQDIISESLPTSKNDKKLESYDNFNDKHILSQVNSELSATILKETPILSNSIHDIDYEAKSKEILNEIEKSIISDNTKITCGDTNLASVLENDIQNLQKDNEELLNDLVLLELDVKSISKIISTVSESRKSLDHAKTTASELICDSAKEIGESQSKLKEIQPKKDLEKDKVEVMHPLKLSEYSDTALIHSPIIAGHCLKKYRTNTQDNSKGMHNINENQTPYIPLDNVDVSKNISEILETETNTVGDMQIVQKLINDDNVEETILDNSINSTASTSNTTQNESLKISAQNISLDKDNWTTSDSFEVPLNKFTSEEEDVIFKKLELPMDDTSNHFSNSKNLSHINNTTIQETGTNLICDIDVSIFTPKGESTKVDVHNITFNNTVDSHVTKNNDELDDILDIIARENDKEENLDIENEKFHNIIFDSITELLDKVENIVENDGKSEDNSLKETLCDNKENVTVNSQSRAVLNTSILNKEILTNIDDMSENDIVSVNTFSSNKSNNDAEKVINTSLQTINEVDDISVTSMNSHIENDKEETLVETISEAQEIIITGLDSDSMEDHILPELEIDVKIELAEDEESSTSDINENKNQYDVEKNKDAILLEIQKCPELILEQDNSDGEQLDNLVEIAESSLDTVEKLVPLQPSVKLVVDNTIYKETEEIKEDITDNIANTNKNKKEKENNDETTILDTPLSDNVNKTFDVIKDPDYEDISEESFEISEILDKNEFLKVSNMKKSTNLPEKYQAMQKSEEVLRILDEISQKSSPEFVNNAEKNEKDTQSPRSITEISEALGGEVSADENVSSSEMYIVNNKIKGQELHKAAELENQFLEGTTSQEKRSIEILSSVGLIERKNNELSVKLNERLHDADDKSSHIMYGLRERVLQLHEQDISSESSEAGDTPRGVSEIEMDSPRDFNDSRLDIDILDDDLLSANKTTHHNIDVKTNFHTTSIVATSEKDIEAMIDKLKASLEQPGLEVAELEAKLLRIEQLQIELEIKKLEAEEVSYYVREIPNKPPPPYTPPGDGRLSTSLGSPSLLTAVIPSNVEELTTFAEKATVLIYSAKMSGEDITNLEAPPEIYEFSKEKNETVRKDREIYNTFLFDLCKETIAEVYRTEYEKPGPSWTKPNVKTKPTMKIPKTVEELTEYVNKEVATLFGFKTRLQRENMVMRWSRKRRDRVDELLAREAQAEEDEWTKFHHDELTVKNGLTIAILDTLVMETANVMKIAYGKKRKLMV